jgi:conjugal transfer ATP-binding protein TraC
MKPIKISPFFNHAEFQAEYSLAKELPYWDFFEDRTPYCQVLSDGTLVQGLALTGLSIETWDADQINQMTTQIRSFLNTLPDNTDLQFLLDVNSDYDQLIAAHEHLTGSNPLISWISKSRVSSLQAATQAQALQKSNLYLFVYLRVRSTAKKLSSWFTAPKRFEQVRREEFEARAHELAQLCRSLESALHGIGIGSRSLSGEKCRDLIYRLLNPLRSQSEPLPKSQNAHRDQEFTPEELALEPNLALSSPREQLVMSDLIQGVEAFFLDGYYHRIVTLKTLPEFTHSALMSRLTTLPFHYLLSLQLQVPDQSRELAALQSKRRMAHSMSASHEGRVTDLESEAKLQSTEELLRELIQTGQKIFYFQTAILIRSQSREDLEIKTKAVLARFREMNGAEGLTETVAAFKTFKTLLPGGNTALVRSKRVKTDNLADFLPLYQSWEGHEKPVCLLQNRSGGLLGYDPFDSKIPNYNSLVTGSAGAGKSFLNNCILLQYLSQNPLVYVIDIGGSYRKLCEFVSGQYIEVTPPRDKGPVQSVNPFLLPPGATEPSPQKLKFLIALFETILTDEDGEKLPKLDKSLLEEALIKTYTQHLPKRTPRISDFKEILESSEEPSLRNFAKMLYPWTGNRPYGRLLDSDNSLDLTAEMVVFDLKSLSSYPDLQSVMILIITDFILGKVENTPNRVKRIIMDECWELLKSRGASSFMEHCVRTLRKTGSGITFITQGLEEIEQSAIGAAILNNTATKFILLQRGDLGPIRKILKLNDQEMALISSLGQRKGQYSEAFMIANENRCVIRVMPTPLEYWLATSDAADNALLSQTREKHPDKPLPEIIHLLATEYPSGRQGKRAV